ncbi:MAG: hypothetical protein U5L09_03865 [Bacteroidales bacterium]|nr:hypothetical protein [Bacteroidales bacterium]
MAAATEEYPGAGGTALTGSYADYRLQRPGGPEYCLTQDGIFIYVPDNVKVEKTIQMVNVTQDDNYSFVHNRNLSDGEKQ